MARAKKLTWSPASQRDLLGIHSYYSRVASSEIADKLLLEIEVGALRLKTEPMMGPPRDEISSGLHVIFVHPYSVFYRVQDNAVEISRIIHEERKPPSAENFSD
jgi:plasmid stabilization system protein ParE